MTVPAREFHTQQVHWLRRTVNFNDVNIATGVSMGMLPAGAQVVDAVTRLEVAFNAGTTNVLTAGTNSAAFDNIVGAGDVTEATPGGYRAAILTAGATSYAVPTEVFVKYTQTGTAASTGRATISIAYTIDLG